MSGFQFGADKSARAKTSLGAIAGALGFLPDFHVQGDVARDIVSQTNLVQAGGAAANFFTTPNNGGPRTIDAAPPPPMATGALNFSATGDAWQAWANTVNDVATQSMLLVATWKVRTITTARNIVGKREVGVAGWELRHSASAANKAEFAAMVAGQAVVTVELVGPFLVNIWHTTVSCVDSVNNRIGIGSTDEAALEAGNESWMNVAAGTLSNAATWAVGAQRLQAMDGEVLHVTQAFGPKVDVLLASKGPKLIARDVGPLMWWDDARGRIT